MTRLTAIAVAVVIVAVVAVGAAVGYRWSCSRSGPTHDEFRVYSTVLDRLAADRNLPRKLVAIERTTSKLEEHQVEKWVPAELRPEKGQPPSNFVKFCGTLCGYDYVWKNQQEWRLEPSADVSFPFGVLRVSEPLQRTSSSGIVVRATRPGFDFWHHRAVLTYTFDCSVSGDASVICVDFGTAYLEETNGVWGVVRHDDFTF